MPEPPSSPPPPDVAGRLHTVADLLRRADHLEPDAQRALADLVDELGRTLSAAPVPSAELTHLTDSTTHLAQALHQRQDAAVASARSRLEDAILRAEVKAPVAADIARRLIEALSNIGI